MKPTPQRWLELGSLDIGFWWRATQLWGAWGPPGPASRAEVVAELTSSAANGCGPDEDAACHIEVVAWGLALCH